MRERKPSPKTVLRVLDAAERCEVKNLRESACVGAIVRTFIDIGKFDHVYVRTTANELLAEFSKTTPKAVLDEVPHRYRDMDTMTVRDMPETRDLIGDFKPVTSDEVHHAIDAFKRGYDPPVGAAA